MGFWILLWWNAGFLYELTEATEPPVWLQEELVSCLDCGCTSCCGGCWGCCSGGGGWGCGGASCAGWKYDGVDV